VRICKEAIRIIEEHVDWDKLTDDQNERITNNLDELEDLCKQLHAANIDMI
jgi:predicted Fe-S protein YdhL (DUF1289 family)